jgi:ABC-type multidrug transport system fused ATPase/permease subunit
MKTTILIACLLLWNAPSPSGQQAEGPAELAAAEQQTESAGAPEAADESADASGEATEFQQTAEEATEKAKEIAGEAADKAAEIAVKIDKNETAQEAAAGILQPIYLVAESLAFPAFYWLAFALMAAGTVSFVFQLVLGKLALLFRGSINLKEMLSDAIGLVISVVGLVLTTQAATENSTFTQSPALVLSATAAGAVLGLFLYRWAHAQELNAVTGARAASKK